MGRFIAENENTHIGVVCPSSPVGVTGRGLVVRLPAEDTTCSGMSGIVSPCTSAFSIFWISSLMLTELSLVSIALERIGWPNYTRTDRSTFTRSFKCQPDLPFQFTQAIVYCELWRSLHVFCKFTNIHQVILDLKPFIDNIRND